MTKYQLHWWPAGAKRAMTSSTVDMEAESRLHGAALALRHFVQAGCDITNPLAHVDMTEANGVTQTVLVEEVLNWLSDPKQTEFIDHEGLAALLH